MKIITILVIGKLLKMVLNIETSYTEGYKRLDQVGRTEGSRNYFFTDYTGKRNNFIFKNNEINFKIQVSQENCLIK